MDFFQAQDEARRRTKLLVFYFAMAVLGIIAAVYALLLTFSGLQTEAGLSLFQPELLAVATVGSVGVIGLGSLFKTWQLGMGGQAVAKELGGILLDRGTRDPHERRLLNIVEEMAIASGCPVPDVYLMEDDSINAFAAGKTTSDAVIGVTRGCMTLLNHDELQGVVAHEFSHILNGDMRLNVRLMGLLFGILMLAVIGRVLMRSVAFSGARRGGGRNNNGGAVIAMLALGVGLFAIGSIGVLFARLIQAAVSRQREFLADASAVQFTRQPDGIAGALLKIGGAAMGSRVSHPRAAEASHMFFANAMSSSMSGALATHPPIPVRVRAILPGWDGSFPKVVGPARVSQEPKRGARASVAQSNLVGAAMVGLQAESVGNALQRGALELNASHLRAAQQTRERIPQEIIDQFQTIDGAKLTVLAVLASRAGAQSLDAELRVVRDHMNEQAANHVRLLVGRLQTLTSHERLAVIDLAFPSLRRMTIADYQHFVSTMRAMMAADQQIDLFEFTVERMVERHLDLFFNPRQKHPVNIRNLGQIQRELSVLVSTLAGVGSGDPDEQRNAFTTGLAALREHEPVLDLQHLGPEECGLDVVGNALKRCDSATPLVKKAILRGCGKTVMADGKVTDMEAELLRAIADAMGCPMPPFVDHNG